MHVKNWLPILFIGFGLFCVAYGGWKLWSMHSAQNEALKEAHQLVGAEGLKKKERSEVVPSDFQPKMDEVIGILHIPKLKAQLPIVEGTDEDELEKGVGHYRGTAFSGQNDQIVLSGHRDTVFRNVGDLKIGDELIVEMEYGRFTYLIQETEIVDADDRTVIRSTAPNEVLTLTTCYPFGYIGNAPQRYIIYAVPA